MRQEVRPPAGARHAGSGDQSFHQVLDVDGAEPPLPAGDLQNQALGDRFQEVEDVGIARPVDDGRADDDRVRGEVANHAFGIQLGLSIVGEGMRLGIFAEGTAVIGRTDRGQRTDVNQAEPASSHGVGEFLGGADVAGVVVVGMQRFRNAGEMDDRLHAVQSALEPFPGGEVAIDSLDAGGKAPGASLAAYESTHGGVGSCQPFQQVRTDEAGTAGHQDHYCSMLRKATSPK